MPVGDKACSPAQSSAATVLAFHFQRRAFSQCPIREHPGLLCKSNNHFNRGPTHPRPHYLCLICNVPLSLPIYLHTARIGIKITLQGRNKQTPSPAKQFPFLLLLKLTLPSVCNIYAKVVTPNLLVIHITLTLRCGCS